MGQPTEIASGTAGNGSSVRQNPAASTMSPPLADAREMVQYVGLLAIILSVRGLRTGNRSAAF